MSDGPNGWPKISVVIATRNRRPYLQRMLDRLFEDDYPNLEVIVIDGASSDGTVDLLRSYGERIHHWVSEPDGGEYFAFNKGLRLASGEIVKPMSDDDTLRPGVFHLVARYFAAHPEVDIVFGQTAIWQERDGQRRFVGQTQQNDPRRLSKRDWLRATQEVRSLASFLRRRVYDRIGYLSTQYACGDMEFWIRAASQGMQMGVLPEVVIDYHYTGANTVTTRSRQIGRDLIKITAQYGSPLDVLLVIWRHYIYNPTFNHLVELKDRLNIHPRRMWRKEL